MPSVKPASFRSSDAHLYPVHQHVPSSPSPNFPSVFLAPSIFTTSTTTISYLNYCLLVALRFHCIPFHHSAQLRENVTSLPRRNPPTCSCYVQTKCHTSHVLLEGPTRSWQNWFPCVSAAAAAPLVAHSASASSTSGPQVSLPRACVPCTCFSLAEIRLL